MIAFFEHAALYDGHLKPAMNLAPGTASLVVALEKDGYGIGYGLTGMETSAVRALAVSDKPGSPGVRPTTETVRSGAYPLSRAVHLYINRAPDEEWDSEAREFIHFIHSGDGREIVERAGWYALPASVAGANLKLLDGRERVRDQP
jgi:phosphate transport system substrate-binding protein